MVTHNSSDNLSGKAAISKNAQRCHGFLDHKDRRPTALGTRLKSARRVSKSVQFPFSEDKPFLRHTSIGLC